jgi:diadenosine tetraphosphatase ApaH/serine/threonine PP2A family protein phosphatase
VGSLSALIDNRIFSVHGGLSPSITTLDQVWLSLRFGMLETVSIAAASYYVHS